MKRRTIDTIIYDNDGPSRDVPQEVRALEMAFVTGDHDTDGLIIMTVLG